MRVNCVLAAVAHMLSPHVLHGAAYDMYECTYSRIVRIVYYYYYPYVGTHARTWKGREAKGRRGGEGGGTRDGERVDRGRGNGSRLKAQG